MLKKRIKAMEKKRNGMWFQAAPDEDAVMLVNRQVERPCPNCDEIHPHKPLGGMIQCQACGHGWTPCRECGRPHEVGREVYAAPEAWPPSAYLSAESKN